MPTVTVETPHTLGREEALRRLKEKISQAKGAFGAQLSDQHDEWNEETFTFAFKAMGMKVSGTVTAEDSVVKLAAQLPVAAMMFRGMIQQRLRQELADLLA